MLQFEFLDLFAVNNLDLNFFRISYSLTGKWNFDIAFFHVLTYCNFFDFCLIEKYYEDNW